MIDQFQIDGLNERTANRRQLPLSTILLDFLGIVWTLRFPLCSPLRRSIARRSCWRRKDVRSINVRKNVRFYNCCKMVWRSVGVTRGVALGSVGCWFACACIELSMWQIRRRIRSAARKISDGDKIPFSFVFFGCSKGRKKLVRFSVFVFANRVASLERHLQLRFLRRNFSRWNEKKRFFSNFLGRKFSRRENENFRRWSFLSNANWRRINERAIVAGPLAERIKTKAKAKAKRCREVPRRISAPRRSLIEFVRFSPWKCEEK